MKSKNLISLMLLILIIILFPYYTFADDENEEFIYQSSFDVIDEVSNNLNEFPTINARYAAIYDRASGTLLYDKNASSQTKMASTTKIMTSIIVLENSNLNDVVTISKKAAGIGGSRLGLSTNDTITVENLLYGLMLCSGNDAAVALAEHVGGTIEGFAEKMNKKASELGLISTHFVTPHGLDNDEHFTTAFELAKLADYALKNETFSKIVSTKSYTVVINNRPKQINNTNELLGNMQGVYGVKTGFTNGANRCLVTSCRCENLDIICVVLGCDTKKDRTRDSIKLINYAFNNFSTVNIEEIIDKNFKNWFLEHRDSFIVNKGISNLVDLKLKKENMPYSKIAINNSDMDNISTCINYTPYHEAPLSSNTQIGTLTLKLKDNDLFSIEILCENCIKKKNILDYLFSFAFWDGPIFKMGPSQNLNYLTLYLSIFFFFINLANSFSSPFIKPSFETTNA